MEDENEEMRYVFISINRDAEQGLQELLGIEVIIRPVAPIAQVVWEHMEWLDGLADEPVGYVVQDAEDGAWVFPDDGHLRVYVQAG